jgi:hypothetical protein
MQHENLNQQEKNSNRSLVERNNAPETAHSKKACKHRSENGWCSKSGRQCPLLNLIFINQ